MSRRERQAPGKAEPAGRPTGGALAPDFSRTPGWEEFFPRLSAGQQGELLDLAGRQGVLYSHQLPPANGSAASAAGSGPLARLLAGQTEALVPLCPEPVEVFDHDLDATQREAVAKALQTPDVSLIQGPPGTGKSRVVAELIRQATARGERVLLLAPRPAAVDRAIKQVAGTAAVFAVRCLDSDESPETLPPTSRGLTFPERAHAVRSQALAGARQEADAAQEHLRHLAGDEPLWAELRSVAQDWQRLQEQIERLHQRCHQLALDLEQESRPPIQDPADGDFRASLAAGDRTYAETCSRLTCELTEVRGRLEARGQELAELAPEREAVRPLVDAWGHHHFWSPLWWRALFRRRLADDWQGLSNRGTEIEAEIEPLKTRAEALESEQRRAAQTYQADRERSIATELAGRQAALDAQEEASRRETALLEEKWRAIVGRLDAATPRPATLSDAAVIEAHAGWKRLRELAAGRLDLARQWADYLEQAGDALTARLPAYVNLVAATTTGLATDPQFGDQGSARRNSAPAFDLLILEEADQVTDSELLNAARRARRWILIGEPAQASIPVSESAGDRSPRRKLPAGGTRAFERLWHLLHCDPRRLPYDWTHEDSRLSCRLRSVAPEQRRWLEPPESVADFPDIKLRILAIPHAEPVLAEIHFPPAMGIEQAKQYVFREIEEAAFQGSSSRLVWAEEPHQLVLRLAEEQLPHEMSVALEAGVEETLGRAADRNGTASAWQTCCLVFDRGAGWSRLRAETWLARYTGLRDLGRTVRLDTVHRMVPELARFLGGLLFSTGNRREKADTAVPVEFVAVPPARPEPRARGSQGKPSSLSVSTAVPTLGRKAGAGLELDLADARHRDRLPAELGTDLPGQGLVNYFEAQAVVRMLAQLAGVFSSNGPAPAIAVIALYATQAELIRRLLRQEPALAGRELEVDVPAAFRQREAAIVLVSLTRSHAHRAVAFGDGPDQLALALTRARERLILFGDPGTLLRRSQWEGPVEHLDERSSVRERELITGLIRQLQGHGSHAQLFPVCQGAGT
jgi:hypothetical protein